MSRFSHTLLTSYVTLVCPRQIISCHRRIVENMPNCTMVPSSGVVLEWVVCHAGEDARCWCRTQGWHQPRGLLLIRAPSIGHTPDSCPAPQGAEDWAGCSSRGRSSRASCAGFNQLSASTTRSRSRTGRQGSSPLLQQAREPPTIPTPTRPHAKRSVPCAWHASTTTAPTLQCSCIRTAWGTSGGASNPSSGGELRPATAPPASGACGSGR